MTEQQYGEVTLKIFETRDEMGAVAAKEAAACIRECLAQKAEINCIFAAAPSQNDFLQALCEDKSIDWSRVNAFHMDDYVGFEQGDVRSFNGFLTRAIFSKLPFKTINLIDGMKEAEAEAARYDALLHAHPTDLVFMGVGENGHIAFNDPSVANFNDKSYVKVVELEESCRQQQVNDGCFPTLADVPLKALTVTVPGLLCAQHVFCMVPTALKAPAVARALTGPIDESCPASILRTKKDAKMYIDAAAAQNLQ